jgi:hypothetical protein
MVMDLRALAGGDVVSFPLGFLSLIPGDELWAFVFGFLLH